MAHMKEADLSCLAMQLYRKFFAVSVQILKSEHAWRVTNILPSLSLSPTPAYTLNWSTCT